MIACGARLGEETSLEYSEGVDARSVCDDEAGMEASERSGGSTRFKKKHVAAKAQQRC